MTNRERFRRALAREPVDRLPAVEWAVWWDQTLRRWQSEGLVLAARPPLSALQALQLDLGLDPLVMLAWGPTTAATPAPESNGAPIAHSEAEYDAILPTLYPQNAVDKRQLEAIAALQQAGDIVVRIKIDGFFWVPRTLMGIEPHLFAFYDAPEWMHRICRDNLAYALHLLDQVYSVLTPDFMTFAEDLSYNNGPMLSEAMFDEFLLPYYRQIIPTLKTHGTRVLIDSDGDITRAMPWFIRAGIEGALPLERQAGVDIADLRATYPDFLFIGHFNKRTMAQGEAAMRAEFERLLPTMRQGGFIPSVDHQTPPDVSLAQYRRYVRLLHEYARIAAQSKATGQTGGYERMNPPLQSGS